MANSLIKTYIVVCEGYSEQAYIQKLNRFFEANDYSINFVAQLVGSSHFVTVKNKYETVRSANKRSAIYIWVDKDTYIRNDKGDSIKYQNKKKNIPDFYFTTCNFEDFLVMHLPDSKLNAWHNICQKRNHFMNPMIAKDYVPLFQNIIPGYSKGDVPIEINEDSLKLALQRQDDTRVRFKCDFLEIIRECLERGSKDEC
jgi:hypothetical protein